MISTCRLLSLCMFVLLLEASGVSTAAPVGTAFTYQGQLKQDGAPANGAFDFRFRLLSAELTPLQDTCVFQVNVVNGLFTADVDFGAAVFDGSALVVQAFVKTHIPQEIEDCVSNTLPDPYTALSPVQPLTPTPYAIHALSAPNGHALDAADGSPANAVFVDNAGNVGIGTTAPALELDVRSAASSAAGQVRAANSIADTWVMLWSGFTNGSNDPAIIWSDDVAGDDLRFLTSSTAGTGGAEHMRITGAGNVGIGTTNPQAPLNVVGEVRAQGVGNRFASRNPDNNSAIFQLDWYDDPVDPALNIARLRLGGSGTGASTGIAFQGGGDVEWMRITGAGDVGIGTTSPSRELEVAGPGDVEIGLRSTDAGGRLWTLQSTAITGGAFDGTFQIIDRTAGVSRMAIDPTGNVGIGTRGPTAKLHVLGTALVTGNVTVTAPAGDSAVDLPDNSISAAETLDEAGVASDSRTSAVNVTVVGGTVVLASRTITVPTDGFVIAYANAALETGVFLGLCNATLSIRKTTAPAATDVSGTHTLGSVQRNVVSFHTVFAVSAGANAFELHGSAVTNDYTVSERRLTLLFVPTAYGTTDAP